MFNIRSNLEKKTKQKQNNTTLMKTMLASSFAKGTEMRGQRLHILDLFGGGGFSAGV